MSASVAHVDKPFRLQADDFRGQTSRASLGSLGRAPQPRGDVVYMDAKLSAGKHSTTARKESCEQLVPSCGTDMYIAESAVAARVATANILERDFARIRFTKSTTGKCAR